jgi:FixJ family two-component response regulator
VILDVSMPTITGPELQARLVAMHSELRILFISAVDDVRIRDAALAAGAHAWFTKPLDGEELLAALGSADRDSSAT